MLFPGYRATDAVITVCQDNARQAIEIRDLNEIAEEALERPLAAVSGLPLAALLPERIRQLLDEYVEFQEDGNDVGAVLAKVQSFCLLKRDGKEVAYRLKVLRGEPEGGNACFHLVLQSQAGQRRNEAFRVTLRENFKGHEVLEDRTQLPDRKSILKDVEFVRHYVNKGMISASIAALQLDQYNAICQHYSEAAAGAALAHIAALARQNLRGDDVIGCVADPLLALLLLDTVADSARMVLNRLRWLIAANPFQFEGVAVPVTVSIAFTMFSGHGEDKDALPRLEELLASGGAAGNTLVELTE